MDEENVNVEQVDAIEMMEASSRAEYDIQIATAKRYPRDIKRASDNSVVIATMDKETAQSCGYAVPRAGKNVAGPSVHLARILASEWGNLRVETKVVNITQTQVVSQAVCFDLEKNYAVKVEVRKSIIGKHGRYTEDMITVTGNAANAIAYRNAVFSVIPKSVTEKAYQATRQFLIGDLSDEAKLLKKRKQLLDGFKDNYGVTEKEILDTLGLRSVNQIKRDQIIQLTDIAQAIKDGDTTVDEAFGREHPEKKDEEVKDKKASMKQGQTEIEMP